MVLIVFIRSTTNLHVALYEFHQNLSSEQKIEFESGTTQGLTAEAVLLLTDEISKSSTRDIHLFADHMRIVLEAVQQYSTIADTAALVWSSIKIVVQVMVLSVSQAIAINEEPTGRHELPRLFRKNGPKLCAIEYLLSSAEHV